MEKLFKYRGVILVVSVPVMLILLVVGMMPRSTMHDDMQVEMDTPRSFGASSPFRYAVVFDAGSTGSRVHIFRFKKGASGLDLVDDTFEQLKPGLSSFADNPTEGANSLVPLLTKAMETVPKADQKSTSIEVRATAGLRLLPGSKAEDLLSSVRSLLGTYPFAFEDASVSIMDGADEGAFQWVTTNYLLGKMGSTPSQTSAAVDLGGGSVQMAYALSQKQAASAPKGYVRTLRGGGATYHVYVHSYLGYGLMAARAAVLDAGDKEAHPCLPEGDFPAYAYAGKSYTASAAEAGPNFDSCSSTVLTALNKDAECDGGVETECTFNGVWGGGGGDGQKVVYVSSYFFDRAEQSGIIKTGSIGDKFTLKAFKEAAKKACAITSVSEVGMQFPGIEEAHAPYFCMDLMYCHTLLEQGFSLKPSSDLNLVKRIKYHGDEVEAAWPLGAAINSLA